MSAVPVLRTEARLHVRHGIAAGTAGTGALWFAVVVLLPAEVRSAAVAWVLFVEVAALGFLFLPALAVVERANGVTAALGLTQLRPSVALAVRVGLLGLSSLVIAVPLLVAAGATGVPARLLGVLTSTLLFSLLAVLMVGRGDTLTTFLSRAPLVAVPLLTPALLDATGLVRHPLLLLSPATPAFALLAGRGTVMGTLSVLGWLAALWVAAVRIGFDVRPSARSGARARGWGLAVGSRPGTWAAARSFAAADRRSLAGDRILLLLLGGIPLIALALRWFAGPGVGWVQGATGVDLAPHVPAVAAFVLVLHVPIMLGSVAGLLFLEDRDAGLVPLLATTPAAIQLLLRYRLGVVVIAAGCAVLLMGALAGTGHPAGFIGALMAAAAGAAVAVIPTALLAAIGRDRVEGMALMKVMGVPLYAPIAWWFLSDAPIGWAFALLPTGWAARSAWATSAVTSAGFAAGAVALSAAILAVLLPRVARFRR